MRRNRILPLVVALSLIFSFFLASCMDLFDNSEVATAFKVTFKANYEGSTDADVVQVYAYGERKTLATNIFERGEGWKFLGWSSNADDPYPKYNDEEFSSFSSDVVLYAIWEEVNGENIVITVSWPGADKISLIDENYKVEENKITFSCTVDNATKYSWTNTAYNHGDAVICSEKDYPWDTSSAEPGILYEITLRVEYEGSEHYESIFIEIKK